MNKLLIFIIVTFILNGCSTSHQSQNSGLSTSLEKNKYEIAQSAKSFEGQNKSVLIRAWGAPKSTSSDGNGGEIYQYIQSTTLNAGKYTVFINMFVNQQGQVYGSDVKHLLQ
jgi:hypothetical protein